MWLKITASPPRSAARLVDGVWPEARNVHLADVGGWRCMVMVACAALAGFAGCGPSGGHAMRTVAGAVRMAEQPAAIGVVRFVPISQDGKDSADGRPFRLAAVANGTYAVPGEMGLHDGLYRVEVLVHRKSGKKVKERTANAEMAEVDELVLISDPTYSGINSPLRFEAGQRASGRFDIVVPAHQR